MAAASATTATDVQTLRDDFVRFCAAAAVETALSPQTRDRDGSGGSAADDDFAGGEYENPVAWHRRCVTTGGRVRLTKDVLFDNVEMRYIALAQYGRDRPEYVKWKLFGYNIVICYEYINRRKLDKALNSISDIEQLLKSIGSSDSFLNSIRIALNHVLFSMKAHVLKLFRLKSDPNSQMQSFVMPNNMDNVNKAGLLGIRALFFYEYDIPSCRQISKDSILKAISLNEAESEWYFLLARVLRNYAKTKGHWIFCEEEFQASKTAVEIGDKVQHKLHLSSVYLRMFKNNKLDEDTKNQYLNCGIQILNEVIDTTNDLVLLKYSLSSLSKVAHFKNVNTLEKLINKLSSSDNDYVHGVLGNYYLFRKKNYSNALFHLKKAYDAKIFGCSFDYIYTLYQMNSSTAPVEQMLVEMLKTFPHPVHQEKILSQIISYLLITKDDLIGALKYIPMLMSLKNITCVYSLLNHRMTFCMSLEEKKKNLLEVLSEKLTAALKDQTLLIDYKNIMTEVSQILKSYKIYSASILMKYKVYIHKKNLDVTSLPLDNNLIEKWSNINKHDLHHAKKKDEENCRSLKPDSNPDSHLLLRCYQKRINDSTLKLKSQFDSMK